MRQLNMRHGGRRGRTDPPVGSPCLPRRQGIGPIFRRACLLLGLAFLCGLPLLATSVIPISDAELHQRADVIVHGVVVSSDVTVDEMGRPETVTVIDTLSVLKGRLSASLVLHQTGGTLPDGRFFKLWGRPEYTPGREVVVFAIARPEGEYQTAELLLGKFEVWQDEAGSLFAVPDLAIGVHPGVDVHEREESPGLAPENVEPSSVRAGDPGDRVFEGHAQDTKAPRPLDQFLASLRRGALEPTAPAVPSGRLEPVGHAVDGTGRFVPQWGNIANALYRWNNNATAAWTLSGTVNMDGGGIAEAQGALASWSNDIHSTINYTAGSATSNVIYLNSVSSSLGCGWSTCLSGGGVLGCAGPTGVSSPHTWRGETYGTISQGTVELRALCVHNGFPSTIIQSALTHELGHTLGLGHSDQNVSPHDVCRGDESSAIMRAVLTGGIVLASDDQDAIRWLYGDGANSCGVGGLTPPTATTGAATGVSATAATLNGTVNPNGSSTTAYFEYGTTTAYGSRTTAQSLGSGTAPVSVSQAVFGLLCNTLYHFRLVATTSVGTTAGLDQTLTTSVCTPSAFYTVTPCRLADTRNASGPSGGPALVANTVRNFPVTGVCGIPSTARAVAVNLAVYQPSAAGDLRVYPAGAAPPLTSSINFRSGVVRANSAILPLGAAGQIAVQCDMPSGVSDFFLDVYGYFQ